MGDVFPLGQGRPKYDESAFYAAAVDSKGHSGKIEVRFPPDVISQIQDFVADRDNPLRTNQDYVRNAVIHRMNYDAQNSQNPTVMHHVAELTARFAFETELAIEENRRAMVAAAQRVAHLARDAPANEKDRLIAQLRIHTIGMSPQGRAQIEEIVRKAET